MKALVLYGNRSIAGFAAKVTVSPFVLSSVTLLLKVTMQVFLEILVV